MCPVTDSFLVISSIYIIVFHRSSLVIFFFAVLRLGIYIFYWFYDVCFVRRFISLFTITRVYVGVQVIRSF